MVLQPAKTSAPSSREDLAPAPKRSRLDVDDISPERDNTVHALKQVAERDGASHEEKQAVSIARHKLALLHLCRGDVSLADRWLFRLGFSWRLAGSFFAPALFRPTLSPTSRSKPSRKARLPEEDGIAVYDNALDEQWRKALLHGFRKDAAYWRENKYWDEETKYFSYVIDLDESQGGHDLAVKALVTEQMMPKVLEAFPDLEGRIRFAEVWAHARGELNGHQMHYVRAVVLVVGWLDVMERVFM